MLVIKIIKALVLVELKSDTFILHSIQDDLFEILIRNWRRDVTEKTK